jgi:hypothetical protein
VRIGFKALGLSVNHLSHRTKPRNPAARAGL